MSGQKILLECPKLGWIIEDSSIVLDLLNLVSKRAREIENRHTDDRCTRAFWHALASGISETVSHAQDVVEAHS